MLTLHGIPNCDQVKKARSWLNDHQLSFEFHDFKKAGVSSALLALFLAHTDWTTLLNRKGTTWRKLSDQEQLAVTDADSAVSCMLAHPSIIKRPVLLIQDAATVTVLVGFSEQQYQSLID